jgi:small multidrug resistance pump
VSASSPQTACADLRAPVISTSGTEHHMHWLYLTIAIVSEVIATSALKAADGFTRWVPSLIVIAGYASAFYFLSLTLRTLPLGVAYAVWSGVGVALIAILGWALYDQSLDLAACIGIGLIVAGVVVLNLFSRTAVP